MDARTAERLRRCLDDPALAVLPASALAQLRAGPLLLHRPHDTIVALTSPPGAPERRVRTLEIDPGGNVLALLAWSAAGLRAAWLRLPGESWVRIEPGAAAPGSSPAPWGAGDSLWHCSRPGETGDLLTVSEAVDHAGVARIPTLWEPGRLPASAGGAVLNLLASLAEDQGRAEIAYEGPYPTEHLFLALLESFRPAGAPAAALAAFTSGALAWAPAPHERRLLPDGTLVQRRAGVEKVVWRGRAYHRPECWGIRRHAPRRIEDAEEGAVAGLWFLGECLERQLVVTAGGDVQVLPPSPCGADEIQPLPGAVVGGLAAIIAATGAPPLAAFVPDVVSGLGAAWGPVEGDLIDTSGPCLLFSARIRAALAGRLARASRPERAAASLAALGEMAALAAEGVRLCAQARLAGLPAGVQERFLAAPPPLPGDTALRITTAVEALMGGARPD